MWGHARYLTDSLIARGAGGADAGGGTTLDRLPVSGPAAGVPSGAAPQASPVDYSKIASGLQKLQENQQAQQATDAKYLKIAPSAPPYNPGGQGLPNLLATLIQMNRGALTAGNSPLGAAAAGRSLLS